MADEDPKDKKPDPPVARANKVIDRLIERHGSAEAALAVVVAQNISYSDQAELATATIADLKKQAPAKDAVVLTGDRAKAFNAFEALKLTPEQVSETVKERDTLKGVVHTHGIQQLAQKGAPNIGYDPEATADLITGKQLHVELRDVEVEVEKAGKKEKVKQQVPFVRPASDDKAPLQPLTEYAKTLPAFEQRALQAATQTTQQQGGTPWLEQSRADGGSPTPVSTITKQLNAKYPTPSELRAKQQPTPAGA